LQWITVDVQLSPLGAGFRALLKQGSGAKVAARLTQASIVAHDGSDPFSPGRSMDNLGATLTRHVAIALDGKDQPVWRHYPSNSGSYCWRSPMKSHNLIEVKDTTGTKPTVAADTSTAD